MCGAPEVPEMPEMPPPTTVPVKQEVLEEVTRRRDRGRLRSGYSGTVLTGPKLEDDEPRARVKTLLGG